MSRRWQDECTAALSAAIAKGGAFGLQDWTQLRNTWISQKKPRPIIADVDLSSADLRNFDLSRCWIGRTSLINANLSGADFSQSIFRDCDLTGCDLRNANFYAADFAHHNNRLTRTTFNDLTNFEIGDGFLPPSVDDGLRDMAAGAIRRTQWLQKRSKSSLYKVSNYLTDHGIGLWKVFATSLVIIIIYSLLFREFDNKITQGDSLLVSARYFLGSGEHYADGNILLSLLGISETVAGLLFLALVVSVFTAKFTKI